MDGMANKDLVEQHQRGHETFWCSDRMHKIGRNGEEQQPSNPGLPENDQ